MPPKRLFIIDAMALVFRSFHAFGVRPLTTSGGLPTSAIYGCAVSLLKIIEEEKPDYFIIATDSKEPTFRHKLYPAYKANRKVMPEELVPQIPYLFKLFEALGSHLLKVPGYEADDIIGTVVKRCHSSDVYCYIVSGDKDFMQLINDYIYLYSPKKTGEVVIVDKKGVKERFHCDPDQVVDVLAIMGDSSDNVPGIKGIGEKGAAKLIGEFGSLENLYHHLDDIRNPSQKQKLTEGRHDSEIAKRLVTIDTDVPLEAALEQFKFDPDHALANKQLLELFRELEFRNLTEKVADALKKQQRIIASKSPQTIKTLREHYLLINTPEAFEAFSKKIQAAKSFCFDTETTGLNIIDDQPIGISFSLEPGAAFYVPVHEKHLNRLNKDQLLKTLKEIFGDTKSEKCGHNLKFDLQMLNNLGVNVQGKLVDTMMCSYLLNSSSKSHGLDTCVLQFLDFAKIPTSELIGENAEISMLDVDLDKLTDYACEDADYTLRLYEFFLPKLREQELIQVFNEIEMPLVPILAKMEQTGVYIDVEVLHEISDQLDTMAKQLEKEIYNLAGEQFNINSTKRLAVILYEKLKVHEQVGIGRLKKTKSGLSTDVSVLEKLSDHPLPRNILEYRTVTKLKNTYVDTLPQLIHPKTGRIHTSFHQTGTATGRLSSSDPNLQNIPIRTELGKNIRKAFRPKEDDFEFVSADYSQVELRLLASLAQDPVLKRAFINGEDIHASTASKIFAVPLEQVDSDMRSQAKAINFGIIYGMGAQRLARETNVKVKEAKEFIDKYFETFPNIHQYIETTINNAHKWGYTKTISGRRRPLPEIHAKDAATLANAENIAVNSPLQGSAADLIKLAMIQIDKELKQHKLGARLLLQVHDELVFECPQQELKKFSMILKEAMEGALKLDVPIVVEIGHGKNWLEAH